MPRRLLSVTDVVRRNAPGFIFSKAASADRGCGFRGGRRGRSCGRGLRRADDSRADCRRRLTRLSGRLGLSPPDARQCERGCATPPRAMVCGVQRREARSSRAVVAAGGPAGEGAVADRTMSAPWAPRERSARRCRARWHARLRTEVAGVARRPDGSRVGDANVRVETLSAAGARLG